MAIADTDLKEKIRESIRRLDEKPLKDWNPAVILQIKKFLFPRILLLLDGRTEKGDNYEVAKKIFE